MKRGKRLTRQQVDELINNWLDSGGDWRRTSYNQIARELGLDPTTIYQRMPQIVSRREIKAISYMTPGVVRMIKRKYNPPFQRASVEQLETSQRQIMNLIMSGMKVTDIVETTGISRSTVYRRIKEAKEKEQHANRRPTYNHNMP